MCVAPGTPCMAETMRKDAHTAGQSMAQAMDMPHGAADSAHRPPAPSLSQPITGAGLIAPAERARQRDRQDRKSVVSGKSVSVRVDLGGRRIIKKKKTHTQTKYTKQKQ